MAEYIETPTMGEILNEEFLIPLGLSAYKVAQEIKVPTSRIQDILHNRRRITVDTSLRLAKFFGVSDGYFMALQDDIDIRNAKLELAPQLESLRLCIIICHNKKFKADTGSRSVRFNSLLALKNCTVSYNSENSEFILSIVCLRIVGFPTYTIKHKLKKTSRCCSLFKVTCSKTEVSEQVYYIFITN